MRNQPPQSTRDDKKEPVMRSSTARKIDHIQHAQTHAEVIDLAGARSIAQIAEAACHIPGNAEACDYEEFMQHYGMKLTGHFE
jgi:hypothetical protein